MGGLTAPGARGYGRAGSRRRAEFRPHRTRRPPGANSRARTAYVDAHPAPGPRRETRRSRFERMAYATTSQRCGSRGNICPVRSAPSSTSRHTVTSMPCNPQHVTPTGKPATEPRHLLRRSTERSEHLLVASHTSSSTPERTRHRRAGAPTPGGAPHSPGSALSPDPGAARTSSGCSSVWSLEAFLARGAFYSSAEADGERAGGRAAPVPPQAWSGVP
jgi:hypothetical protein